jgi:hypothetical protein
MLLIMVSMVRVGVRLKDSTVAWLSGREIDYFPQVQSLHVQLDPQEQLQGPMIDDLSLKSTIKVLCSMC